MVNNDWLERAYATGTNQPVECFWCGGPGGQYAELLGSPTCPMCFEWEGRNL